MGQPIVDLKHQLTSLKSIFLGQGDTTSLRGRAMNSGAWIGAGFAVQKALQFGSNLILTRLLFPEAFGLMALATVFLVGLAMFSDVGIKPAIIRDPRGDDPDFLNTAWTIQVIRGLILCVVGALIAYPISLIYGQPILFPLLALLSTTAAISGFSSISLATAERRLNFRSVTIIQIVSQVLSIFLLVLLSYVYRSVWSLAFANVISTIATVAMSHLVFREHSHRLLLQPSSTKSLFHFGRWVFLSTLATYLGGEGLRAVQGGLISPAEFGVLTIAYTIAGIPNDLAMRLSASIGLPALAETYRTAPDRAYAVLHALRMRTLGISLTLFVGAILAAQPAISLLYDPRYHSAADYLVALCVGNAIAAIASGYNGAILAMGQASTYFLIIASLAIIRVTAVAAGFHVHGIIGMLYGIACGNLLYVAITWIASFRLKILDIKTDILSMGIFFIFSAFPYILFK
ncbi:MULTISPECIES: oligosaccharide flippase family protein [unclassified Sphingopyxis]|uniref:oligosaccharide flippase family protein n=1 Tax=unclassified Sphingopyxis TaxID=2614943 RepID=UPI0024AD82FB|nr:MULTISPECIES: oligosaccharide flippase family protein [unclassified Sphingopyxis]